MSDQNGRLQIGLGVSEMLGDGFEEACVARGVTPADVFDSPSRFRGQRQHGDRELLALDSLPPIAWQQFDEMLIREGEYRLAAVAALPPYRISNPMGTSEIVIPRVDDGAQVNVGMNPEADVATDILDYSDVRLPLPYTWVRHDFPAQLPDAQMNYIAEVLRNSIRAITLALEASVFTGTPGTYAGKTANGLNSLPAANTKTISGAASKFGGGSFDGEAWVSEIKSGRKALTAQRRYGPWEMLVHPDVYIDAGDDYVKNAASELGVLTIRNRIRDEVMLRDSAGIPTAADAYILQAMGETVRWGEAMAPSVIQWVSPAGYTRHVLVVAKAIPVVVSTASGHYGAYHWN